MKTDPVTDQKAFENTVRVEVSSHPETRADQPMTPDKPRKPELDTRDADDELTAEILEALADAKHWLTDDGLSAIIAIRRQRRTLSILEELLLLGKIDARLRFGISEDTPLAVDNFEFAVCGDGRGDNTAA